MAGIVISFACLVKPALNPCPVFALRSTQNGKKHCIISVVRLTSSLAGQSGRLGGPAFLGGLKNDTFISYPMLIIRKEQMAVFSRQMVEVFADRAAERLRAKYQERLKDTAEMDLRSIIHDGIAQARAYGITYEKDVLQYLEYTISLGTEFDTNPELSGAQEILAESIDGTMKIILLSEYIQSQTMEKRWADRK